jgi:O-antigen/teichoic acid export membrane protein
MPSGCLPRRKDRQGSHPHRLFGVVAASGVPGACTVPAMRVFRRAAGGSGALLAGSVVNGLAAYGFIAFGTRSLGADGFAPVAIVWVFWAFSAALLTFPIQHWVIRQMALDGHSGGLRAALGRVVLLAGAVSAGEGVVALVARRRLFGDDSWAWPLCVAGVAAGAGLMGLLRGVLAGSGRFHAAAVAIGGENIVRLAAAGALLAVDRDPRLWAAALLAGPLVGLLWPRVLRFDPASSIRPATGLVGAAGLSVLLAQIVLNGGPPLLAGLGAGEAEVTALFAALALFRAPYLVALGLTVRVTAPLTRRAAEGGRRSLLRPALAAAGFALVLAALSFALAWPLGPPLIRALFGAGTAPSGPIAAAAAGGCVLAVGSLALTVMLIAASSRIGLVASWGLAVAVGAAVVAGGGTLEPAARVVAAFDAAEVVAVVAAVAALAATPRLRRIGSRRRWWGGGLQADGRG